MQTVDGVDETCTKARACFAQKTTTGTKLPEPHKMPAGKAALAGIKRLPDREETEKEPPNKKVAAIPTAKIWELLESENDTEMVDF